MRTRVLMIDRKPLWLADAADLLMRAQHAVTRAADLEAARIIISDRAPALILIGRPSGDLCRHELCAALRPLLPAGQGVIIVALPRGATLTAIRCLDEGADATIEEPVDPYDILLRAEAPHSGQVIQQSHVLRYGALTMDLDTVKVHAGKQRVDLGPTAFRLLRTFLENPEQMLSRRELIVSLGHTEASVNKKMVDSQVRRLRSAMAPAGLANLIVTVASIGYMLSGA
jgi:two-component system phosphate regulon response regulator PhoB